MQILVKHFMIVFSEAEYAFRLKKPIIPLNMETGYRPDGWLGLLIGSGLIYDFSNQQVFDEKFHRLLAEIKAKLTSS